MGDGEAGSSFALTSAVGLGFFGAPDMTYHPQSHVAPSGNDFADDKSAWSAERWQDPCENCWSSLFEGGKPFMRQWPPDPSTWPLGSGDLALCPAATPLRCLLVCNRA